jgi:hypothetical protein
MEFLCTQEHGAQREHREVRVPSIPSIEAVHPRSPQGAAKIVAPLSGLDMPAEGFEPPTNGLQIWAGNKIPKLSICNALFLLTLP